MKADKIILGKGCVVSSDSAQTGLNNNIIVCGTSGCGKTMSITEARLLETYHTSMCVTVTKRRIVDKYKPVFLARGYDVWELDFVNPQNSTVGYDPLAYVYNQQDITHLAELIAKTDSKGREVIGKEPFWQNAATSLLAAEIAYVYTMKKNGSFADVLKMHDKLKILSTDARKISTTLDDKFEKLERIDPDNFAITCWNTFRGLPFTTAHCVYGELNASMDTVFDQQIRGIMDKETQVDFSKLASKKTILFITTSPVNSSTQHFINLFYGNAFKQLFEYAESCPNGVLPLPVHVLCDDFATGGRILNFAEYISIFREKGISVTLLLQSESQLASMYGEYESTTIINNCDTYTYMGGMDITTARHISERTDKPLEEILYMPIGNEIILRRGQKPIYTQRYDIINDKKYQRIFVKNERDQNILER